MGKTINPAFFYAVLLWKPFLERCEAHLATGMVPAEARAQAGLDVLKRQATRTIIPRFAETFIREVWEMQTRLLNPKPQQIAALSNHALFHAGFDFLLLREKSGDETAQGMGTWWDTYQNMSADEKERAISQYNRQRAKSRRKATTEAVVEEPKQVSAEIEPLVKESEARTRRSRKTSSERDGRDQWGTYDSRSRNDARGGSNARVQSNPNEINADHPIMKRRRVQRDLTQVVFGPTQ